ncbi:hypothetical protein KAREA_46500 [Prescottella equi]|nr:hypothetical protein KAREA_46500 [Prescottella equi]
MRVRFGWLLTETFQRSNLHTITAGQRARSGPPDDAAALTRKRQAQIALEFNSLEFNKEVVDFGKSALQTNSKCKASHSAYKLHTRQGLRRHRLSTLDIRTGRCCLPWVGAV